MASMSPAGGRGWSWGGTGAAGAGGTGPGQTLQLAGSAASPYSWPPPHSFGVFAQSPAVTSPVVGYAERGSEASGSPRAMSPTTDDVRKGMFMGGAPMSPSPDSPQTAVASATGTLLRDEPDVARNREKVTFLSLPCKNNGKAPESNGSGGMFSKILSMKSKDNGQYKASGDVDFKGMLLPSILEAAAAPTFPRDDQPSARPSSPTGRKSLSSSPTSARSPSRNASPFAAARNAAKLRDVGFSDDSNGEEEEDYGLPPLVGRMNRARNASTSGINSPSRKASYNLASPSSNPSRGPSIPDESQWLALNQLRIHAGSPERSTRGVERILQYFAQLEYLEKKFPFESANSKIHGGFRWFEAFGDQKMFSSNTVITDCIQYEKGATLYNLAALYSQLGCSARLWTPEGLKEAGNYFQKAAGVLTYLRNSLAPRFRVKLEKSSDLSEGSLTAAIQLCLAQACECFYERANKDQTSKSLSKVAAQTSDLYEQALETARSNQSKTWTRFPAEWFVVMRCKRLLFQSIALLHTENSLPDPTNTAVGERVVRLRLAVEAAESARKEAKSLKLPSSAGLKILVEEYLELMLSSFMLAESANMQNYHQTEPDRRLLAPPPRPKTSLVESFDFKNEILGDDTRFIDLLEGVKAPQVWGDFNAFAQSAKETAAWGVSELKRSLLLLEGQLGKLHIRLASSGHYESAPVLSSSALMAAAGAAQQVRAETDQVLAKLVEAQAEESMLSSADVLVKLEELNKWTSKNLEESVYILDNIDTSSFSQDPSVFAHVGNLRSAVSRVSYESATGLEALSGLKGEFSMIDMEVLEWNEEKLQAIIPMLQKTKDFVKQHVKNFDREKCLQQAEEIRQHCELKIRELISVENDIDTVGPTTDLHVHLGYRRRQLQLLEGEVAQIIDGAETLASRVEDVLRSFESVSNRVHEERESRQIVKDFDRALSRYTTFREDATREVERATELRQESVSILSRCLKLPTKPKGPGGFGGFSFGGAAGGNVSSARDPLLLSVLQKESKPSQRPGSPSTRSPSSSARSPGRFSPGGRSSSPGGRKVSEFRHDDFIESMPDDDEEMLDFVNSRRSPSIGRKAPLTKTGSQAEIMKRLLVKAEVMAANQSAANKQASKPAPIVTSNAKLVEDALRQLVQAQAETQASIQRLAAETGIPAKSPAEDFMFISNAHNTTPISAATPLSAGNNRKLQRTRSHLRQLREASQQNLNEVQSQLERKSSLLQRMSSSASNLAVNAPDLAESAGAAIKGSFKKLVDGARNIVTSAAQAAEKSKEERDRRQQEAAEQRREQRATDPTAFISAFNSRNASPMDEPVTAQTHISPSVPRRPIQPKEAYGLPSPTVPIVRDEPRPDSAKTISISIGPSVLHQKLDRERASLDAKSQANQLDKWIRSSNDRERLSLDGGSRRKPVGGDCAPVSPSRATVEDMTEITLSVPTTVRTVRLEAAPAPAAVAASRQVSQLKSAAPSAGPSRKASGAQFLETDLSLSTLANGSGSNVWGQIQQPQGAVSRVPVDRVSLVPGQPRSRQTSRPELSVTGSRLSSVSALPPMPKSVGLRAVEHEDEMDEEREEGEEEEERVSAKVELEIARDELEVEVRLDKGKRKPLGLELREEEEEQVHDDGLMDHHPALSHTSNKWADIIGGGVDKLVESDDEIHIPEPRNNNLRNLPVLSAFTFTANKAPSLAVPTVTFGVDTVLHEEEEGEAEAERPTTGQSEQTAHESDSERPAERYQTQSHGKKKKKGRR